MENIKLTPEDQKKIDSIKAEWDQELSKIPDIVHPGRLDGGCSEYTVLQKSTRLKYRIS